MEAKILEHLGEEVTLIAGAGGIFDVKLDERLLYSKKDNGNQFPDEDAMVEVLRNAKA